MSNKSTTNEGEKITGLLPEGKYVACLDAMYDLSDHRGYKGHKPDRVIATFFHVDKRIEDGPLQGQFYRISNILSVYKNDKTALWLMMRAFLGSSKTDSELARIKKLESLAEGRSCIIHVIHYKQPDGRTYARITKTEPLTSEDQSLTRELMSNADFGREIDKLSHLDVMAFGEALQELMPYGLMTDPCLSMQELIKIYWFNEDEGNSDIHSFVDGSCITEGLVNSEMKAKYEEWISGYKHNCKYSMDQHIEFLMKLAYSEFGELMDTLQFTILYEFFKPEGVEILLAHDGMMPDSYKLSFPAEEGDWDTDFKTETLRTMGTSTGTNRGVEIL